MSNDRVDWKLARIFAKRIEKARQNLTNPIQQDLGVAPICHELKELGATGSEIKDIISRINDEDYEATVCGWDDGCELKGIGFDEGVYESAKEIIRRAINEQN